MIYMSTTQKPSWLRRRRKVVTNSTTGTAPTAVIDEEHTSTSPETIVQRFAIAGAVIGLLFGALLVYVLSFFGFTVENWTGKLASFGLIFGIFLFLGIMASASAAGFFLGGTYATKNRDTNVTEHSTTTSSSSSH
jgi:hypothetical protein